MSGGYILIVVTHMHRHAQFPFLTVVKLGESGEFHSLYNSVFADFVVCMHTVCRV